MRSYNMRFVNQKQSIMKNLALLLFNNGKKNTKLFKNTLSSHVPAKGGDPDMNNLEVDQLSDKEKSQLKAMKFPDNVQKAIDAKLKSNPKSADQPKRTSGSAERRSY